MRDECNWTPRTLICRFDPMTVLVKVLYSFGNPGRDGEHETKVGTTEVNLSEFRSHEHSTHSIGHFSITRRPSRFPTLAR